jgi:hypothetical protein
MKVQRTRFDVLSELFARDIDKELLRLAQRAELHARHGRRR